MNGQLVGSLAIQRSDLFRSPAILRRYCRRHARRDFIRPAAKAKKVSPTGWATDPAPRADRRAKQLATNCDPTGRNSGRTVGRPDKSGIGGGEGVRFAPSVVIRHHPFVSVDSGSF